MEAKEFWEKYGDIIRVAVTAVLTAAAAIVFDVFNVEGVIPVITYVALYLFIGYEAIIGMIKEFVSSPFNEDFLMVVATVGALVLGEYVEAIAVMTLFTLGEVFEEFAEIRSENAIVTLTELMPEKATILTGEGESEVATDDVKEDDVLVVKTGDRVVCDGVVLKGKALVNTSMITGESVPITALTGVFVNSGAIISNGYLEIKVTATADRSSASRILELVKEETGKKAKKEKFIKSFAKVYTPAVLVAALLVAFVPALFGGTIAVWVKRALNLLVISCPCALVISVPLAYFAGVGSAFRRGIIVRGGAALERAAEIDEVVFDKTGTLTKGDFKVLSVTPEAEREKVLLIAAMLEQYSNHPIAQAIKEAYGRGVESVDGVEEIAGQGLKAGALAVGNAKLMASLGIEAGKARGGTVVFVAENNELVGSIEIGDAVKKSASAAVGTLKKGGVGVRMLTGDNLVSASAVAKSVGIEDFRAELMPEDKLTIVEGLAKDKKVAFVGDGINDAPALAASHLAIAMGGGTDVASLCSDVVLTDNDVRKIPTLFSLAKKTSRIVKENIFVSIGVKVAALVLSVMGIAPMWLAILADVGVMAAACLNSMRLIK